MDSDVHTDGENKQCGPLLYQIQAADRWQCRWAMKESSKNLISEIKYKINVRRSHTQVRSTTVERASEATFAASLLTGYDIKR